MKRIWKITSSHRWIFVTALVLCALPGQAAAQTKVAVINFQNALLETADMKKQSAALESKYKDRQDELTAMSAELQEIQGNLETATGAEAQRLQLEGQRKQRTAQRLTEDLQSDVEFDRQNILTGASARMRTVIEQLRVDRGFDLIVDGGGVLAASALIDLTADATRGYDEKHPAN